MMLQRGTYIMLVMGTLANLSACDLESGLFPVNAQGRLERDGDRGAQLCNAYDSDCLERPEGRNVQDSCRGDRLKGWWQAEHAYCGCKPLSGRCFVCVGSSLLILFGVAAVTTWWYGTHVARCMKDQSC